MIAKSKTVNIVFQSFVFSIGWLLVCLGYYFNLRLLPFPNVNPFIVNGLTTGIFIAISSLYSHLLIKQVFPHYEILKKERWVLVFIIFIGFISIFQYHQFIQGATGVSQLFVTLLLLLFATIIGSWLIEALSKPSEMIPVCFILFAIDIFSVFQGPSKEIAEIIGIYYSKGMTGPPPLVDYLIIKFPAISSATLTPVFGVSDWIIAVFFTSAAMKFDLNDNALSFFYKKSSTVQTIWLPVGTLGLYLALIIAWITDIFIPALPVMVLFFLGIMMLRYPEMRQLEKKEYRLIGIITALLILMIGLSQLLK